MDASSLAGSELVRVASGGGRVLVVSAGHTNEQPSLRWKLLEETTGRPVRATQTATLASAPSSLRSLAAAWVEDGFVLLWSLGGETSSMEVQRDGAARAPVSLPIASTGLLDVAGAGSRLGLVTDHDGDVEAWVLDPRGALERGPLVLSRGLHAGHNRKPRFSFAEELFAVSWEGFPERESYATVFDRTGAIAPQDEALGLWGRRRSVGARGAQPHLLRRPDARVGAALRGLATLLRRRSAGRAPAPRALTLRCVGSRRGALRRYPRRARLTQPRVSRPVAMQREDLRLGSFDYLARELRLELLYFGASRAGKASKVRALRADTSLAPGPLKELGGARYPSTA